MERAEDQRRYFIFSSAISEVVNPILRQKLSDYYQGQRIADFQAFLDHRPVRHILFHLRYNNRHSHGCCTDRHQCHNQSKLPLVYNQWNLLYTTTTNPTCGNQCYCKYTANSVNLNAIDLTLASLMLIKLCILPQNEEQAVNNLRDFKNDHLSHNNDGCIQEDEFDAHWQEVMKNVLILDPDKKDDLIRILHRPMDARLYEKYRVDMMEIHKKILEIDEKMDEIKNDVKMLVQVQTTNATFTNATVTNRTARLQYRLGQDIFCPQYTEIDLLSLPGVQISGSIGGILMTQDDRIVVILWDMMSLLICNSDGSFAYTIPLEEAPWDVTAITDSLMAVTVPLDQKVIVYDINRRVDVRTIPVPGECYGITTSNNRFVVGGEENIWVVDLQTWKIINTIQTDDQNCVLTTSGDRFFSCHELPYLTCHNQSGEKLYTTISLPSKIWSITSLLDGSLYVTCGNLNLQVYHVSPDGQSYELVQTKGLKGRFVNFNKTIHKLSLYMYDRKGIVKILHLS